MLDQLSIFDALYTLAADERREQMLFGSCAPLAHEAFRRSLVDKGLPIVWFEVPLSGDPRFDLHVALSREVLRGDVRFLPDAGNGYDELLRWYAEEEAGGNGLAFAYDVVEGRIEDPAIHVNVNDAPLSNMSRFFDLAAGGGAAELYSNFVNRLPEGWRVWYAGVHPGRPGLSAHVDCFVETTLKDAYAANTSLFEADLLSCGFEALGPALHDLAMPVLDSPFGLELQFDVMDGGALGSTLGVSAGFSLGAADTMRVLFEEGGPAAGLLCAAECMGLADDRWRLIPDATFTKLVHVGDTALALYCVPTFVKLRMRDGVPLDAKAYMQAGAHVLA